ncbi:MAG: Transcription factor FapR [Desulfovibrio sp.]
MQSNTHLGISHEFCGTPIELSPGKAVVSLVTTAIMAADSQNLVHGGFVFGMADYAAMLAVNDPNVVLGSADMKFLKPVRVGETLLAAACVKEEKGKKRVVEVIVSRDGEEVVSGTCVCFVLDKHVLDA